MNSFRILNTQRFFEAVNEYNCGKSSMISVNPSDVEFRPYEVKPSEGYEMPVNELTGETLIR